MAAKQKDPFRWLYMFFIAWVILAVILYVVDMRANSAEKADVAKIVELVESDQNAVRDGTLFTIILTDGLRTFDIVDSILIRHEKRILLTIQGHIILEGRRCWLVFNDLGPVGTPTLSVARCGEIEFDLKRLPPRLVQEWYDERVREALKRLSHGRTLPRS